MTVPVRETLEEMQHCLKELAADLCESAQAQTETANAMVQIADVLGEVSHKVGMLFDAVTDLNERFGRYVTESARERSGVRDVDRRLRAIEEAKLAQR